MNSHCAVLLLAGGSARRFGKDKRRAGLGNGKTLLELSIACYRASGMPVCVCLSARREDDDLEALVLGSGASCIRCSRAGEGMGSTLAEAVRAMLQKTSEGKAVPEPALFVALADMPAVTADTLRKLEAAARPDHIVYPTYQSQRGHPVAFGTDFLSSLESLSGDVGASSLLRAHATACTAVAVNDRGVLLDADTPAALASLLALLARGEEGASSF